MIEILDMSSALEKHKAGHSLGLQQGGARVCVSATPDTALARPQTAAAVLLLLQAGIRPEGTA